MSILWRSLAVIIIATVSLKAQDGNEEPRTGGEVLPVDRTEAMIIERIKNTPLNWFGGVNLQIANPQGELQTALVDVGSPGSGIGFDFRGGYYMDPIPVALTAELGFSFQDGTSKRITVQSGLFRDTFDVRASSVSIPMTLSARFMPNLGTWVFPYVEGIIGYTLYSATYSVKQQRGEEIRSNSDDRSDGAFTYGIGLGASVKIADFVSLPNTLQRTLIDVRMRYLHGSAVEVSNVELLINEFDPMNSSYVFRTASVSTSDNVYFSVGLTFQF